MDNRQFSLHMAVERCKGSQLVNNDSIVDIAGKFYHYLSQDSVPDNSVKTPEYSSASPRSKKGK